MYVIHQTDGEQRAKKELVIQKVNSIGLEHNSDMITLNKCQFIS